MLTRTILALITVLALVGCDRGNPGAAGGSPARDKPTKPTGAAPDNSGGGVVIEMGDDVSKIVIEAEDGKIEAPMKIHGDANPPAGCRGPKGAGKGKYVETPEPVKVNPATGKRFELKGGRTTIAFDIPDSGKYCFWLRVWWRGGCANSFNVGLDGMPGMKKGAKPHQVTDGSFGNWRWIAVGASAFEPTPIRLKKGKHTLAVTTGEDGSVLDQVLIVDDPEYQPTGIEKPASAP